MQNKTGNVKKDVDNMDKIRSYTSVGWQIRSHNVELSRVKLLDKLICLYPHASNKMQQLPQDPQKDRHQISETLKPEFECV